MTTFAPPTDALTHSLALSRHTGARTPRLDDFLLLAPRRENPRHREIEGRSLALAQELGLVHEGNRARFDACNQLGRHVYPSASVERGEVCAMWCNWLFFFDDLHDDEIRSRDDNSRARRLVDHYLALLSGARAPSGAISTVTGISRARAGR